jgi:ABC-type sugar transport system substrate-binding protein
MLAGLVAGCGGTQTAPAPKTEAPKPAEKKIQIGVTLPMIAAVHWASQKWGYEDEAKKLGAEVTVVHADGYQNIEKQINQIQDFVAKKVDAIIVAACDANATVKAIEEAIAKGIPVLNVNNMTNSDKVACKIRSDDYEMGVKQAELMIEALGGKGTVVMINAPAGSSLTVRGKGFREHIEKNAPNIKILAEQFIAADPAKATSVMEDFLQTYPNVNGVFTWSDTCGVPVAHVVKARGKVGKVFVTTMDYVNPDCRTAIRDGLIYGTVAQQPILLGRLGIQNAVKLAKKETVQKQIFSPIVKVTKANADTVDLSGIVIPGSK